MNITDEMLAPEVRAPGAVVRRILPFYRPSTFQKCNRALQLTKGKGGFGMAHRQLYIPRLGGMEGTLRLCVYRPLIPKENHTGVLWIHGGGYAIGTPELDAGFIRMFVQRGCTVVAPDYCLSEQAPYPAALYDCYTALLWLKTHCDVLGVRPDQLVVGGDSAGGGLTAALSIYARDKGDVAIAFQMPLYPMLDDRMITPSSRDNDAPVWNTRSNENGWRLYLGPLYGTDDIPPYAVPARLTDFSGLPPAFTFVGGVDPFHDETVDFMERLRAAGIPAEYRIFEGCYHGFDVLALASPQAKQARAFLMEQFDYAAAHYFAPQPIPEP